ncbi:unnamed protein product [Phytophthora fragariaefolia]|uniref:Unnamed protein product n=1 Tax=Phytophthora fragariaefolia TaxID=1490495 RepID=A0A9W6TQQ6_9STRA|nr:unnamed protein product [Phytophthora fragariaefolia]
MEKAAEITEKQALAKKALQAIQSGNAEELKKFLLAGADPDVAPTNGIKNRGSYVPTKVLKLTSLVQTKTVLFETAKSSTYELLLKNGANANIKNSWHETPLHFHAYNWSSRLVRVLIASGADVNAVNKKNITPLDNAIFRKPSQRKSDDEEFMEVCRVLLRNKALVSWSDPDEYFQLKGKLDSESVTVKARLQLVHEWNLQRKKGDTSFKLPIEAFRRGETDIATYYAALNRRGQCRESMTVDDELNTQYLGFDQDLDKTSFSLSLSSALKRLGSKQSTHRLATAAYASPPVRNNARSTTCCSPVRSGGSELPVQLSKSEEFGNNSRARDTRGGNESIDQDPDFPGNADGEDNSPETSPMHRIIRGGSCQEPSSKETGIRARKLKEVESPKSEKLLYRSKICVVGPSRWGKTSFIKSFIHGLPTLESFDIRTIGIDLFPWSFDVETEAGEGEYQVSFWDFAGQEEYRAAHTLFYSSRTLYLVCINLERYHAALTAATDSMDQTVDSRMMDAFTETHIFRWVRLICAHHPQAEFAFLGTKADCVGHDRKKIAAVQQDVVYRFKLNVRRMRDRVQHARQELEDAKFEIQDSNAGAETTELDDQIASCDQILRKQPVLLSEELIVYSSADMADESNARGKLKALLMMSGSSVLLPPSYAEVDMAFLSVSDFIDSVVSSSKFVISKEEMLAALHLLHDTGDLVWFDGVSNVRLLQERLFLDPMLVIEFIRQIVNHKLDATITVNGYMSHALLHSLPFWREIGKTKKMAWNSDLIVPVYWNRTPETTATDVKAFPTDEDKSAGMVELVRWEYSFEPAIPENLYEKLAVATFSPLSQSERSYSGSSFTDKAKNEFSSLVAKEDGTACGNTGVLSSVLSVSVVSRERTLAWQHLMRYCVCLENLLKTYPGLLVTRCTVPERGQRFNVDQLLSDQDYFTQLSIGTDQKYLPADMEWYTNKSRQPKPVADSSNAQNLVSSDGEVATEMAQIVQGLENLAAVVANQSDNMEHLFEQNAERIKDMADKIQRSQIALITGMQNKAKCPSLWTLEYQQPEKNLNDGGMGFGIIAALKNKVTTTAVLKFRSELSGKYYHDPITISVAPAMLSSYGKFLKAGLTLLSAATPDFCGKDVLGLITDGVYMYLRSKPEFLLAIVECVWESKLTIALCYSYVECKRQLDRSMEFHEVLCQAGVSEDRAAGPHHMENNRDLNPNEILTLLSRLLKVHNDAFQIDDIPQLSGLVCGVVVSSGEYIWASRDEILQHGNDIVLAADYVRRGEATYRVEAGNNASIEVSSATVDHRPVLTETLPPVVPTPPLQGSATNTNSKVTAYEDSAGTNRVLQAMRRRLSSSKSAAPIAQVQRFLLKIIGAKGLHVNNKQNPYCICRFDTPHRVTLLQVQTTPHTNGGRDPSWSSQLFEVALPIDIPENSAIIFIVKHGKAMGSNRLGRGSIPWATLKSEQSSIQEVCLMKKDKPAGMLQFSLVACA